MEIPLNVEKLNDFEFYKHAFYFPVFEENKITFNRDICKTNIATLLILDGKRIKVDPDNLVEICFKITHKSKADQDKLPL